MTRFHRSGSPFPSISAAGNVLVVAHDAGSAEIIASWLRTMPDATNATYVLDGPAAESFNTKLGPGLRHSRKMPDMAGFDLLVCGTSGQSDLERRAIRAARQAGVRSVAWLNHWTNYALCFASDGGLSLPDELWVSDEHAERIAAREFPGIPRRNCGNPYLDGFGDDVAPLDERHRRPSRVAHILYVAEPVAFNAACSTGDPRALGYDEWDALRRTITILDETVQFLGTPDWSAELRIRRHPAEPPNKYNAFAATEARHVRTSTTSGRTLAQDVAWADVVIGCDTVAMVAALYADRRVLCAIPPGGRPMTLPFSAIDPLTPESALRVLRFEIERDPRHPRHEAAMPATGSVALEQLSATVEVVTTV